MNAWFEKAAEELDRSLEMGEMSAAEHREAMRDLQAEIRAEAEEAADRAYNDLMGEW